MYEERFYRNQVFSRFKMEVSFKESDLLICSDRRIEKKTAEDMLKLYYRQIEEYIEKNPLFFGSLSPVKEDENAPPIVKEMMESSRFTGIGPFSSVAGAISYYVGNGLLDFCGEIIVENGGDIFLKINEDKKLGVYLGDRFGMENLILKIKKRDYPFGIASSSSVIGHSLNFGKADLVTVVAKNVILADGLATSFSNEIKKTEDVDRILEKAKGMPVVEGLLVALENKISLWGDIEIAD